MTLGELFARHQVLGLDSNVFIYLFEGQGPLADAAQAVVDGIDDGLARGVLATIGLTEVLSRPASLGDGAMFERYVEELNSISGLRVVGLDAETAVDAAWGRSGGRDLGDAVHIATARRSGATALLTNDRRIRGRSGIEIVLLSDIEVNDSGGESPS
jgi:predicted nucleic acid-binding protein